MENSAWIQQDGARPYIKNVTLCFLCSLCFQRECPVELISCTVWEVISWLPISPDSNPCSYFLWGYLKGKKQRSYTNFKVWVCRIVGRRIFILVGWFLPLAHFTKLNSYSVPSPEIFHQIIWKNLNALFWTVVLNLHSWTAHDVVCHKHS
jgi:hypothetical protein